jgi:hypothetical protein
MKPKPPEQRIRFHLDENVAPSIAIGLRLRGIDVTTTNDAALAGSSDEAQLSFSSLSGRVIVTHDDDFLRLHAESTNHAGIAFCGSKATGALVRGLALIHDLFAPDKMASRVEFL